MNKNQTIAIALIVIIVVGAAGVYLIMFPPGPTVPTIVIGTTDSVESNLDMALAYDYFGWEMIIALSSGLVEIEPGSEAGAEDIEPALATDWIATGGGTIWDFELRENVTFPDGREFNATDVKYTFDRNCNLTGVGLFELDGPQLNMEYNAVIKNVTIISEFVVRFYLWIPFAPFLQLMSCAASYMVDRAVAPMDALLGYANTTQTPCALGPYLLDEWVRIGGSDDHVTLVKNPDYWNAAAGYPKTDRIIIKMYASDTALASAMTAKEIDIAYRQLTASQINAFKADASVKVWEGIGAQIQYLCFNQDVHPYDETAVRQALAAGINRTHVCASVFLGTFDPLYSMIPQGMAYANTAFNKWEYNKTLVAQLLAPFGYNNVTKLKLNMTYESSGHYPQSAQQALVYEQDWEDTGVIDVTLYGLDWPSYKVARDAGSLNVFMYGWYPDFIDPDNYEFLPFAAWLNMGYNSTYPAGGIAQYNLWVAGRSATNDTARQAAYVDLQNLQADECSVVPLWQSSTTAVTSLSIKGVVLDITVNWRNWLLYIEAPTT
jgi:peptide/nickel transport system substrate-binding protein